MEEVPGSIPGQALFLLFSNYINLSDLTLLYVASTIVSHRSVHFGRVSDTSSTRVSYEHGYST
jgi:hypothetical protein